MVSTLFRDPQTRSSALAALGTPQPRAFGSLKTRRDLGLGLYLLFMNLLGLQQVYNRGLLQKYHIATVAAQCALYYTIGMRSLKATPTIVNAADSTLLSPRCWNKEKVCRLMVHINDQQAFFYFSSLILKCHS